MEYMTMEDVPFNAKLLNTKTKDDSDMEMMTMEDVPFNTKLVHIGNEDDGELVMIDQKWGFLKNIVNIDRFFAAGGDRPDNSTFIQLDLSTEEKKTLDEQAEEITRLTEEIKTITEETNTVREEYRTAEEQKRNETYSPYQTQFDELETRRSLLITKDQEAKAAKAAMEANAAPVLDLDTHSYPKVTSFFARDAHWVEGTPGTDGFPVSTLKFDAGKATGKFKGWQWGAQTEGVTNVRVNMFIKMKKAIETDGTNWGVKIYGVNHGQDALNNCEVDKWCWVSVTGPSSQNDEGYIKLNADDVSSAFEADVKQLTVEEFAKEVDPLPAPKTG